MPRALFLLLIAAILPAQRPELPKIQDWKGRTILVFTPHPDDDTFGCGGTLALLAKNGNRIFIAIYTNDDKGSYDLDMNSQRLAAIRKAEEETACSTLGISKENILWMGHHDGMLEYVNPLALVEQTTAIIRKVQPYAIFSIDPGREDVRWHKTDHRMAAMNTVDAIRASEWHLYFPNQRLSQGLMPWKPQWVILYYTKPADANIWVDIDADLKIKAAAAHVSQFEPAIHKYRPDWDPADLEKFTAAFKTRLPKKDGRYMEAFRATRY